MLPKVYRVSPAVLKIKPERVLTLARLDCGDFPLDAETSFKFSMFSNIKSPSNIMIAQTRAFRNEKLFGKIHIVLFIPFTEDENSVKMSS